MPKLNELKKIIELQEYISKYAKKKLFSILKEKVHFDLTETENKCFNELIKYGVTKFPVTFYNEAKYLMEAYVKERIHPMVSDKEKSLRNASPARASETGSDYWKFCSFSDEVIFSIFFKSSVLKIISNYYGSFAHFRRVPFIKSHTFNSAIHSKDVSTVYHTDYSINQIGVQMLLTDLKKDDSHMIYLKESHKKYIAIDRRLNANDDECKEQNKLLELKYEPYHLIGEAGSLFIFDNGNGLHRGDMHEDTRRNIMQVSLSRGDYKAKVQDREPLKIELSQKLRSAEKVYQESVKFI